MKPRFLIALLLLPLSASSQSYYDGMRMGTIVDGECLKRVGASIASTADRATRLSA